jgi:aspartate beta-hydroxylase/beta-hydroxylase
VNVANFLINNLNTNPMNVLNWFISPWIDIENRPVFFNVKRTCPMLSHVDESFLVIRKELVNALKSNHTVPYHHVDKVQRKLSEDSNNKKKWNTFFFKSLKGESAVAKDICPKTFELISEIPNVTQAFFSILEEGKSIPKHKGPYRGYLRYHLGLVVPKENTPIFFIDDKSYQWKEGESILFDDSFEHWVTNNSIEQRVVLVIDILRPLPNLGHVINNTIQSIVGTIYSRLMMAK